MSEQVSIRFINNFVLPNIYNLAHNKFRKDLISVLYFALFAVIGIVTMSIGITVVLEPLFSIAKKIYDSFNKEIDIYAFDGLFLVDQLPILFKTICASFMSYVIRLVIKKRSFITEVISICFIILIYIFYFNFYYQLSLIIVITFTLMIFYPLGSGSYFKIVQYFSYLEEIIFNFLEQQGVSHKKTYYFLLPSSFIISYLFAKIFMIEFIFAMILTISIILLIWMYKGSSNKEGRLLKKFITYILFLMFTIIGKSEINVNIIKIPLEVITFFFALDRIVALLKEVHSLIRSKSILYYYDHETLSDIDLLKELIDLNYIDKLEISESELVRQITILYRLNLKDSFVILSQLYLEKGFQSYRQFVEGNRYFIEFDRTTMNTQEDLDYIKSQVLSMIELKNQKILLPRLFEEYAIILFYKKEYQESIKYFNKFSMYLNVESLDYLCEAYKCIGDNKSSNAIKNRISIIETEKNNHF